jgi:hypothetical protein
MSHKWAALVCMSVLAGIVILAAAQAHSMADFLHQGYYGVIKPLDFST